MTSIMQIKKSIIITVLLSQIFTTYTSDKKKSKKRKLDEITQTTRNDATEYSNQEITEMAANIGYEPTRKFRFNSHGEDVYKKGRTFITRDNTGHIGGTWKKFNDKGKRLGTYSPKATTRLGN